MLGPVGMLTHAVSEVSASSRRDGLAQRALPETRDFLNVDCIMTSPLIDQVGALPAASLQDNS